MNRFASLYVISLFFILTFFAVTPKAVNASNSTGVTKTINTPQLASLSNNTLNTSNSTESANGIIVLLPPVSRNVIPILTVIEQTTVPAPENFLIQVFQSNGVPLSPPFQGSSTGTKFLVTPGTYQVYQPTQTVGSSGYVAHYSGGCNSSGFVQLSYFMSKICKISVTPVVP